MSDIVRDMEKYQRGWTGGLPETKCGFGSKVSSTIEQRKWIPQIINDYAIETIADIGAGDLNWITHMDMPGVVYTAYDLVPRREQVIKFDLVTEIPPQVDMIMCLWVLNHMPMEECRQAIANLKASGSKFLMITDRPKWHAEQPEEIQMPYVECLEITKEGDRILLIQL